MKELKANLLQFYEWKLILKILLSNLNYHRIQVLI